MTVVNHVEQAVVVEHKCRTTVVNEVVAPAVIELTETAAVIISPGAQGPAGPRGQPGPSGGSAVIRVAGETLSALVAVYELPDGTVYALDAEDDDHIDLLVGITITSASAGTEITIQRSGPLDAGGLGLTPGRVWLGQTGRLTQAPPETGFDILLGYATAEQRIYLDPQPAITLEE